MLGKIPQVFIKIKLLIRIVYTIMQVRIIYSGVSRALNAAEGGGGGGMSGRTQIGFMLFALAIVW